MKPRRLRINRRRALALLDAAEKDLEAGLYTGLCGVLRYADPRGPADEFDLFRHLLNDPYAAERLWLRRALWVMFSPEDPRVHLEFWWPRFDRSSRLFALDLLRIAVEEGWDLKELHPGANTMFFAR